MVTTVEQEMGHVDTENGDAGDRGGGDIVIEIVIATQVGINNIY